MTQSRKETTSEEVAKDPCKKEQEVGEEFLPAQLEDISEGEESEEEFDRDEAIDHYKVLYMYSCTLV